MMIVCSSDFVLGWSQLSEPKTFIYIYSELSKTTNLNLPVGTPTWRSMMVIDKALNTTEKMAVLFFFVGAYGRKHSCVWPLCFRQQGYHIYTTLCN